MRATKVINPEISESLEIKSVNIRPGSAYKSYWKHPIYEIETKYGSYIASPKHGDEIHWNEFVGQTVKVYSQSSEADGWLWLRYKYEAKQITLSQLLKNKYDIPSGKNYVYYLEFDQFSYVGFTSQNPPEKRFSQHKEQCHTDRKNQNLHYHMKEFLDGGGTPNFKIIGIFEDEISALLFEVYSILSDKKEKREGNLNISDGGEGNLFELCFQDKQNHNLFIRDKQGKCFV